MKFYSKKYRRSGKYLDEDEIIPSIVLISDNRDDYGFESLFKCYYIDEKKDQIELGGIKIIQRGETNTQLPTDFERLDQDVFFSKFCEWETYNTLNKELLNIKKDVLVGLQDIHYCNYSQKYVDNLGDAILIKGYGNSLYRDSYYGVGSNILNNAQETVQKILNLSKSGNDYFLSLLLYGSVITTLESYLGDTFKSVVLNHDMYMKLFLEKYKRPNGSNKVEITELYKENNLGVSEYVRNIVEKEMNKIVFHNVRVVNKLYKEVLGIDLPQTCFSFFDAIENRHNIFHRKGKNISGEELQIDSNDIEELCKDILLFINELEEIIIPKRGFIDT